MPLPTSTTWNLADFSGAAIAQLIPSAEVTPAGSYFSSNENNTVVFAQSDNGVEGSLRLLTSIPSRFTLDVVVRFPQLPHNLGDLASRRFGMTMADDSGRGFTLYFAKTGVAISRVDNYGAITALPDTNDVTEAVATTVYTIRIAVDGGLGRAYVFVGQGRTETPALRWIVPVEQTPSQVGDLFRIFVKGKNTEPVLAEIYALRLAGDLVVANYPPVADAGADRVAPVGQAVRFDGRASYDVEGVPLRYRWTCVDAPYGSTYAHDISGISTSDDGDQDGLVATVQVPPASLPSWLSVGDIARVAGGIHEVQAVDTNLGLITFTFDDIPDDLSNEPLHLIRQSVLLDRASSTPVAVPDMPGLFRFQLIVNDGEVDSEPAEVLANITALQTPMGVEPEVQVLWKAIGDEWRFIPGRDVFEQAWVGVAQILAGKLLEAWQTHYNSSIRDAQQGFMRKWVAFRTVDPETDPDSVTISPRFGGFTSTWNFAGGGALVHNTELDVSVLQPDGTLRTIEVSFAGSDFPVGGSPAWMVAQRIHDALFTEGLTDLVEVNAHGTRGIGPDLMTSGTAHTTGSNQLDATYPSWVGIGDVLVAGGKQFACVHVAPLRWFGLDGSFASGATVAYTIYRTVRVTIAGSVPFSLGGSAADALGLPAGRWNTLEGTHGVRVTDRVYYVEGFDLGAAGVRRGDLLVLNNGESFRIDRVLSDPADPGLNRRVLLFDRTPEDTAATWAIPSVVRSEAVDYELNGAYPGDLAKAEIFEADSGQVSVGTGVLVAQKGTQLAVNFDTRMLAAMQKGAELRFLGVKHRKALRLPDDVLSIPTLQDVIAQQLGPQRLNQHVDYILEPFYRDLDARPIPMLQFRDATFITPNLEPPDVLWAETVVFDNQTHVEALFGRLVGFLRDDAATFGRDFNYVSGVAGLLYAQQRGPNLFAMSVGAQILLGQPFAEAAGYIEEIRGNYSPRQGRILIRDADGNVPTQSDTVRAYYYQKDPNDLTENSGLALNQETGLKWKQGDLIPQFSPIGAGVELEDLYDNPQWWRPFANNGAMFEIEKFHSFACTFNLDVVDLANITLLFSLLARIKPTYNKPWLVGAHHTVDEIDIQDDPHLDITAQFYDTLVGYGGYRYDDYRGNGETSSKWDDGITRFDAIYDSIVDRIRLECRIAWAGGSVTLPTTQYPWTTTTPVIDVDGAKTGVAGSTFMVTNGMTLPAGNYQVNADAKTGPVLPPL